MQEPRGDIPPKLSEALLLFEGITDETERAALLIDYAGRFEGVPEWIAKRPYPEDHRAEFCESEAYVWAIEQPDRTLKFYFAVESPSGVSAKALCVILDKSLSGADPEQVANISPDIVYTLFRRDISMGKGMGLTSIVQTVQQLARRHVTRLKNTDGADHPPVSATIS